MTENSNYLKNRKLLWVLLYLCVFPVSASAAEDPNQIFQSIVHGLDYVSVDYPSVVQDGIVIDKAEYAEQLEIAQHVMVLMQSVAENPQKKQLLKNVKALHTAVQNKADAAGIVTLCQEIINLLISSYDVKIAPSEVPSVALGQQLYVSNCVACHGDTGLGDGKLAMGLSPKPANFHDLSRQQFRNVYALYNTISLGVADTAMPSFSHFTSAQRWALAFYISRFIATDEEIARGEQLWPQQKYKEIYSTLKQFAQIKPVDVLSEFGQDGLAVLAYLRSNPQLLQHNTLTPLDVSRKYIASSINLVRQGKPQEAYQKALAAYFEGFELIEAKLNTISPELRSDIEREMMRYRKLIKQGVSASDLEITQQSLLQLIDMAEKQLGASVESSSVSFITSLVILLREGLEAILVLAAIVSVLIKSGRRDALRYVHIGWVGALVLGLITWFIAAYLIDLSGTNREITEGITALVAAGMLFYVGFWLHNQSHSKQWQKFVRSKINTTVTNGTLWGLAFIAFLSVYREVFESILFYQSLLLNSQANQHVYIVAGIVVAVGLLVLLAWLIMRYSVRLPLRTFFRVNMLLMLFLAVVFAGKGVAALQEAGVFPANPVNFPRFDLLGIYPNLESLALQFALICLALIWGIYDYLKTTRKNIPTSA